MVTAFEQRLAGLVKPTGERKPFNQRVLNRMIVKPDWSGERIPLARREQLVTLGQELRAWMRTPLTADGLREHFFSFEYLPQLVDNASELQIVVNQLAVEDLPSEWYVDLYFTHGAHAVGELLSTIHFTQLEAERQLDDDGEMFATTLIEAWILLDAVVKVTRETHRELGDITRVAVDRVKFELFRKAIVRFGVALPEVTR